MNRRLSVVCIGILLALFTRMSYGQEYRGRVQGVVTDSSQAVVVGAIDTCYRSTTACLLGNIALRSRSRADWDDRNQTVVQEGARKYLSRQYREPWKLEV
jgi:hypothetical protein